MSFRFLAAFALVVPAVSHAQEKYPVAPVALALTLFSTGSDSTVPGNSGAFTRSAVRQTVRISNADVLEAMRADGLISEVRGWNLVAVWGFSTDDYGTQYRFYARRERAGLIESVAVPESMLAFETEELPGEALAYKVAGAEGREEFISGEVQFKRFNRIIFSISDYEGRVSGVLSGSGQYVRFEREFESRYRPGVARASLQGAFVNQTTDTLGVVVGALSLGTSKFLRLETASSSGGGTGTGGGGPTFPDIDTSITVSVN